MALEGASDEILHSLGVAVEPVFFLLAYMVVFAFPEGRIGRAERLVLLGMSLYFLVAFVPWLFFSPVVSGGAPLVGCNASCPANGLMIADRPDIAAWFGSDLAWVVIALLTATIALLVIRLATASRPRRRTLLPVYVPALVLTVPVLAFHGFAAGVLHLDADEPVGPRLDLTVARVAMPFGFLLAIAQASLFAGSALKRLIGADRRQSERVAAAATSSPTRSTTRRSNSSSGSTATTASWTRAGSRSTPSPPLTAGRRASSAGRARRSRRSGTTPR